MNAPQDAPGLAAVVDDFRLGSPAQELLDRFLVGTAPAGEIAKPLAGGVVVHARDGSGGEALARRGVDFGVTTVSQLVAAVAFARAILFIPGDAFSRPPEPKALEDLVNGAPRSAHIFVAGRLAHDADAARRVLDAAAARGLAIAAGGYLPFTWRLPAVDVPYGAQLTHAVVVTVGSAGAAEFHGLDALLALVVRRDGGEKGVTAVTARVGGAVWSWLEAHAQVRGLLAAAISRTDSPQGDALVDGRTQDLAGLGLLPKLAREPVAWEVEHVDGLRSVLFVLNGVVADTNFAVRETSGRVTSAQLYLPPAPGFHYWTALARRAQLFLAGGEPLWPAARSILLDGLLAALDAARARAGSRLTTSGLQQAYAASAESHFER